MSNLKTQLIRLGEEEPRLREHLSHILDELVKTSTSKDAILQGYVDELLRQLPEPDRTKDDSMMTAGTFIWQSDHQMAPDMVAVKVSVLDYQQGPVVQVKILEGAMGTPIYDSNDEYLPDIVHRRDDRGVAKPPVQDMTSKIQQHLSDIL